jgi:hypothetical protein
MLLTYRGFGYADARYVGFGYADPHYGLSRIPGIPEGGMDIQ